MMLRNYTGRIDQLKANMKPQFNPGMVIQDSAGMNYFYVRMMTSVDPGDFVRIQRNYKYYEDLANPAVQEQQQDLWNSVVGYEGGVTTMDEWGVVPELFRTRLGELCFGGIPANGFGFIAIDHSLPSDPYTPTITALMPTGRTWFDDKGQLWIYVYTSAAVTADTVGSLSRGATVSWTASSGGAYKIPVDAAANSYVAAVNINI